MSAPLAYTDAEIASLLRVSKRTVYRLRKSGALSPVVRIGRAVRIPADSLAQFLERARLNGEREGNATMSRHTAIRFGVSWLLLAAFLFGVPEARAQGSRKDDIVLGVRGLPVAGATVAACTIPGSTNTQPCSPLATLYPNSLLTNPTIASAVRSGGNVTITTSAAHGIPAGQQLVISGVTDSSFNGTFFVQSASTQSFTYAQAGLPDATSGSGTVSAPNPFQADASGNYHFYAAPGKYTVQIYGPQIAPPFVETDVILPCPPGQSATGCGSVSSVALTAPAEFSVSGSPITTSGTLAITKNSQNANTHYSGPTSGGAAPPTFRADVAADLPATTSNCAGVQFAQGLNAGGTPACTTPPTFGASGASHAVGYVPDPGSTAGTTHFLREDATWQTVSGGVSEATWSSPQFSFATAITQAQTVLPNAHTLERFTIFVQLTLGSCTTSPVLAFKDLTSNTVLSSFTVANATPFTDSGALSVSMTAGDTFGFVTTTAGVGCTGGSNATITAVFK